MAESTTSKLSRTERCKINAQTKSEAKRQAFMEALALMVREGQPIVKAQVCRRAGVTPPFVGKHPDLQQALEEAQRRRQASPAAASANRGKDRLIEALRRQLDTKQTVIHAKEADLREKDRTISRLLGKLAANQPLADSDLHRQLQEMTRRAERAEARVAALEEHLFAKRYVRAARFSRRWHPSKRGVSAASPEP